MAKILNFFKGRNKGAPQESPAYRQMVTEPDYWNYMFTFAHAAYEGRPRNSLREQAPLTTEQKVVYLSAVTAIFEIIYEKGKFTGDQRMDSARGKLGFLGGWVAQNQDALAALPKEPNRESFDLTYTHPADPTVQAHLWAKFDEGLHGLDDFGAEIRFGPRYQSELEWLVQSEDVKRFFVGKPSPIQSDDLNLEYGQRWTNSSGIGRDGWNDSISLKIARGASSEIAQSASPPKTIYLSANRHERLL